jgi:DNA-binding response OmpR family regulator
VRVLVVEDEQDLAVTVARVLRRFGIAVDVALDGREALMKTAGDDYDVVVLDRSLPLVSGDEVCSKLNANAPETKILMLTARDSLEDRVAGLELGADDYLSKPFAMRELVARVQALGRRRGQAQRPVLRWNELELDSARRLVTRGGRPIATTAKELAVLEELMIAGGATVSADRLLNAVWDDSRTEPFLNTVRVTVMRLRRKLGQPDPIETVIGCGYRLQ